MQRKTQRFLPFAVSTYWKLCQYTYTTSITYISPVSIWRKVTMKPFLRTRNTNENLKPFCITRQSIRNYLMRTYSPPIEHVECRCHLWSPFKTSLYWPTIHLMTDDVNSSVKIVEWQWNVWTHYALCILSPTVRSLPQSQFLKQGPAYKKEGLDPNKGSNQQ